VKLRINTLHTFRINLRHGQKLTSGTTVTATLRAPDLTESQDTVSPTSRGVYSYDVVPSMLGLWRLTMLSVGAVRAQRSLVFLCVE
jgi:hypothetical protein